jgi:hypothetical protein
MLMVFTLLVALVVVDVQVFLTPYPLLLILVLAVVLQGISLPVIQFQALVVRALSISNIKYKENINGNNI